MLKFYLIDCLTSTRFLCAIVNMCTEYRIYGIQAHSSGEVPTNLFLVWVWILSLGSSYLNKFQSVWNLLIMLI